MLCGLGGNFFAKGTLLLSVCNFNISPKKRVRLSKMKHTKTYILSGTKKILANAR